LSRAHVNRANDFDAMAIGQAARTTQGTNGRKGRRRPRERWLTRGDFNVRFLEYHWTSITVNLRT
jgi:hypothetical protein